MGNTIHALKTFSEGDRKSIDTLVTHISKTIYTALFSNEEDVSCEKIWEIYETIFDELGLDKKNKLYINRRKIITHIVVELLENLQKHATIDKEHPAYFELREEIDNNYNGHFVFETTNYAEKNEFISLKDKVNNISDINESYEQQMEKREVSEKWGAGLWIFTIIHKIKKRHSEMPTKDILRVDSEDFDEENKNFEEKDEKSIGKINTKVSIPNRNIP